MQQLGFNFRVILVLFQQRRHFHKVWTRTGYVDDLQYLYLKNVNLSFR